MTITSSSRKQHLFFLRSKFTRRWFADEVTQQTRNAMSEGPATIAAIKAALKNTSKTIDLSLLF